MKVPVTNTNLPPRAAPDTGKTTPRKNTPSAGQASNAAADDPVESSGAQGRDFASVLEEVSRPREQQRHDSEGEGDGGEPRARDRAEGEQEARRREERQNDGGDSRGGGGFDSRAGVREAAAAQEPTSARAILHIADLERVVSAVRAQTLAGGVREVTIELRRSVLEGLSVKLRLDGAGRVAAEFIASSERVRAQIDARAPELAELMRSRGVNLSSLHASVGADTSGRDNPSGRGETYADGAAAAVSTSTAQSVDDPNKDHTGDAPDAVDATTYRA